MLDLNFASELARRAELLFSNEDMYDKVLNEYRALDPREANIIYQSFNYKPGTLEHIHATTRISALVASGAVSKDLATLSNLENIPSEDNIPVSYNYSRTALEETLDSYADGNTNVMDPDGHIARMIRRGDSKSLIVKKFMNVTFYQSQLELLDAKSKIPDTNLPARIAIFKFEELVDALDNLEDLPFKPDFRKTAKEAIASYDTEGTAAGKIDAGASALDVFNALSTYPAWEEDARDFITRDDVESPTYTQQEKWGNFLYIVNSIKNIDDL